ncbi:glycosyltransferase family 4 protein [Aestuariibacter salexigens]|uniref:glycosyltransferase family 4 protein n=1 Tax=Aestuariibacter salexigens TaxID=226010 RepID=UPI000403EE3D|nr:glycosyltransferase family 4 protein [Aestuariibacter salexigens]
MKVLFLQNVLFDYRVPFYNGLVKRGLDVTVVHSGKKLDDTRCLFTQRVVPEKSVAGFHWQLHRPRYADFDVVIAMFDPHWPQNLACMLNHRGYRRVLWGHGFGSNALGNKLRCLIANRADAFVLYTEQGRQQVINGGVEPSITHVANNTVEVANHEGKSSAGQHFLYVGRLQARKRIDLALTAFADVISKHNDSLLRFDIVGDGDIRDELIELTRSLGIAEKVQFHGAITDNQQLKPLFHNSLAYVSPGHLGLGINHAMAFGTPVLSVANRAHAPEVAVLNQNNSIMFKADTDQQIIVGLSKHMLKLATNPDYAMALSSRSYQDYVDHCSMDRMLDGFEAAIRGSGEN